jgi:hypothetical protein
MVIENHTSSWRMRGLLPWPATSSMLHTSCCWRRMTAAAPEALPAHAPGGQRGAGSGTHGLGLAGLSGWAVASAPVSAKGLLTQATGLPNAPPGEAESTEVGDAGRASTKACSTCVAQRVPEESRAHAACPEVRGHRGFEAMHAVQPYLWGTEGKGTP